MKLYEYFERPTVFPLAEIHPELLDYGISDFPGNCLLHSQKKLQLKPYHKMNFIKIGSFCNYMSKMIYRLPITTTEMYVEKHRIEVFVERDSLKEEKAENLVRGYRMKIPFYYQNKKYNASVFFLEPAVQDSVDAKAFDRILRLMMSEYTIHDSLYFPRIRIFKEPLLEKIETPTGDLTTGDLENYFQDKINVIIQGVIQTTATSFVLKGQHMLSGGDVVVCAKPIAELSRMYQTFTRRDFRFDPTVTSGVSMLAMEVDDSFIYYVYKKWPYMITIRQLVENFRNRVPYALVLKITQLIQTEMINIKRGDETRILNNINPDNVLVDVRDWSFLKVEFCGHRTMINADIIFAGSYFPNKKNFLEDCPDLMYLGIIPYSWKAVDYYLLGRLFFFLITGYEMPVFTSWTSLPAVSLMLARINTIAAYRETTPNTLEDNFPITVSWMLQHLCTPNPYRRLSFSEEKHRVITLRDILRRAKNSHLSTRTTELHFEGVEVDTCIFNVTKRIETIKKVMKTKDHSEDLRPILTILKNTPKMSGNITKDGIKVTVHPHFNNVQHNINPFTKPIAEIAVQINGDLIDVATNEDIETNLLKVFNARMDNVVKISNELDKTLAAIMASP
ncbi:hypothetical protein SNEBB_008248 [Seison nebaliae]|nr:hypothetical protein SNEBB_008248 [Seison nebaliae]